MSDKFTLQEIAAALGIADQGQAVSHVVNSPPPAPAPAPAPTPSGADLVAHMRAQLTAMRAGFPSLEDQRRGTAEAMLAALGVKTGTQSTPEPAAATGKIVTDAPVGVPPPAPPPPPPAPMAHVVTDRPLNILSWDRSMHEKFYRARGGNWRDFSDPKNSKIWDEIATMTKHCAQDMVFAPGSRRR